MSICLWMTGLSGAGKTTTASALVEAMTARGYSIRSLDGDEVRRTFSNDLGFSRADRHTHALRVAGLAKDIIDRGQIAVCALISPYRHTRECARQLLGAERFVEVFVHAPLDVCMLRDPKGLYAQAREGLVKGFTAIDAPYEPPLSPDVTIQTATFSVHENVQALAKLLVEKIAVLRSS